MFKAPLIALAATASAATLGFAAVPAAAKAEDGKMALTVEHRAGKTLYCLTEESFTGTRLPTKTCQTRAEWAAQGIKFPEDRSAASKGTEAPKG